MRRPGLRRWALCLVVCGTGACAPPSAEQAPSEESPDDVRSAVVSTLQRYMNAVESADTTAIRALYVQDGRFHWIEDGAVRYRSVDEVLGAFSQLGGETSVRYSNPTVVRLGQSSAHAYSEFEATVGSPPAGYSFSGLMSFLLERGPDGWLIVGGHVSSPRG